MNTIVDRISTFIEETVISRINGIDSETLNNLIMAIVAAFVVIMVAKKLMQLSIRILLIVLIAVFVIFAGPRINVFIANKLDSYGIHGILQQKLSEIIDGDIETKVIYDYKVETGIDLGEEDRELIEQLKAEAFQVNPNMNDELNLIANAGFPAIVTKTILINISDPGTPSIQATSFADYTATFLILRMTTLLSYLIAFSVAAELFKEDAKRRY